MYLSPFLQQYLMVRAQNPATAGSAGGVTSLGAQGAQNPMSSFFNPSPVFPTTSGQQGGGGGAPRVTTVGAANTPATAGGFPVASALAGIGAKAADPLFPSVGQAVKDWTKGIFNGSSSPNSTYDPNAALDYSTGYGGAGTVMGDGGDSFTPITGGNGLDQSTGYTGAGTVMGDGGGNVAAYDPATMDYAPSSVGAAPADSSGDWFSSLFDGWSRGGVVPGYASGGVVNLVAPTDWSSLYPGGDGGFGPGNTGPSGGPGPGPSSTGLGSVGLSSGPSTGSSEFGPNNPGNPNGPATAGVEVGPAAQQGPSGFGRGAAGVAGGILGGLLGGLTGPAAPVAGPVAAAAGRQLAQNTFDYFNPSPTPAPAISPVANFQDPFATPPDYSTPVQSEELGPLGPPGPPGYGPGGPGVGSGDDAGAANDGGLGGSTGPGSGASAGSGGYGSADGQGSFRRGGVVPLRYAGGGAVPFGLGSATLMSSPVPGRTDALSATPQPGSVVIPADVVSGAGQGNTMAGDQIIRQMLGGGAPLSMSPQMGPQQMPQPGGQPIQPIQAAGGEEIVDPAALMRIGGGDIRRGQQILNDWIMKERQQTIREMQRLPGPYSASR
jgi:hypothetical protein